MKETNTRGVDGGNRGFVVVVNDNRLTHESHTATDPEGMKRIK
jgi:hypothetical protein